MNKNNTAQSAPMAPEHIRTGLSAEALRQAFLDNLFYVQGRSLERASANDLYQALAYTLRDRILQRWMRTVQTYRETNCRTVCYLSAEYLPGPHLGNNLLSLGIIDNTRAAMRSLNLDLDAILGLEEEPGLGNGGLGRLAACFMDSLAALEIPAIGYGIRYEYGIFDQDIVDGWQVETSDTWLHYGNPWEVRRPNICFDVKIGGRTETYHDEHGHFRVRWLPGDAFRGVAHDTPVPGYGPETTLYEALFANHDNKRHKWPDPIAMGHGNHVADLLGDGWFPEKAIFEEYRTFGQGHGHDLAPFDVYHHEDVRGLRWPVVEKDGKWVETPWRFNEQYDPYARKGSGFDFYGDFAKAIPSGNLDGVTDAKPQSLPGKAKIFFRPYAAPVEKPDAQFDLWLCTGRVIEHWHTGTMTRRVPELHRAVPAAVLWMHPADAEKRGFKRNDLVWVESRRGKVRVRVETGGRNSMPRGYTFVPFFDEGVLINRLTLESNCPISKENDFKKCAVKVYRA